MEYYPERLEREIKEIIIKYPSVDKLIKEIIKSNSMSSFEFDYQIEKDHSIYKIVEDYLDKLNKRPNLES